MFEKLSKLVASQGKLYVMLKSALQVFAIRLLGAAATYGSMVLIARYLGSFNFGVYAYVLVIVMLLGLAFSLGFNSSGLRFVASYLARKKIRRLSGFLNQTFRLVLTFSVLGSLISAGLVFAFRSVIEPYYVVPLLVGLLCVPVYTIMNQCEATARAFGWVHVAYIPNYILRPVLLTGFVGGLTLLGDTVDAVSALWAMCAATALAVIGQGLLIYVGTRKDFAGVKPAFHTRHWMTVSLSFFTIDGFRMLLDNTDVLLIGRFLDPHSVAIYYAVIRTSGLIAFVSFSVIALAVPKFAELHSAGKQQELQTFVATIIQLMFWPSALAAIVLAICGPYLLSLFGADFASGYPTMLIVLFGLVLRAATLPVEHLLNMSGHHRDTLRVYGVAALVNIGLNLWLIPAFGIIGAATATYVAMIGGNIWLYVLVRKRLGIDASLFAFWNKPQRSDSSLVTAPR